MSKLTKDEHKGIAVKLTTARDFTLQSLFDCSQLYGTSGKVTKILANAQHKINEAISTMDDKFFQDYPEATVSESPYYGSKERNA